MVTVAEMKVLMANKTDQDLNQMFAEVASWSDEAFEAARAELKDRKLVVPINRQAVAGF